MSFSRNLFTSLLNSPGKTLNHLLCTFYLLLFFQFNTSASACITVIDSCFGVNVPHISDTLVSQSGYLNSSPVTSSMFYIEKTIHVDQHLTLENCILWLAPGVQLIVDTNITFTLDSSIIQGCGNMWQNIVLRAGAHISTKNSSRISDANEGIYIEDEAAANVQHTTFSNCVTGIYIPPHPLGHHGQLNHSQLYVSGSTFAFTGAFKPDYTGQPAHLALPQAGIAINDWAGDIGDNSEDANTFTTLITGITGYRSHLKVQNNYFNDVAPDAGATIKHLSAAILCTGDITYNVSSTLEVSPLADNSITIKNCHRGIYTKYSTLAAANIEMQVTHTGVEGLLQPPLTASNIEGCTIAAVRYGINWSGNDGATLMYAGYNSITMSGDHRGIGIYMKELSTTARPYYYVDANTITVTDASCGISAINVAGLTAKGNIVTQNSATGNTPPALGTYGIKLEGCEAPLLTCNNIYSDYDNTDANSFGLHINNTTAYDITCNGTHNNNIGIYFGGDCTSSDDMFSGNVMEDNYTGLYLNNTALIGDQILRGNQWLNYTGTYGAENQNNQGGINASEFIANATSIQFPSVYPSSGWFFPDPGSTFGCGNSNICTSALSGGGEANYFFEKLVVNDSTLTIEYISEAKTIAKQYLYEQLQKDTTLLNSDSVFANFNATHSPSSIGKLFDVKTNIKESSLISPYTMSLLKLTDSLISQKKDSLFLLDNLMAQNPSSIYSNAREGVINLIGVLQQTQSNTYLQIKLVAIDKLNDADVINAAVVSQELPLANEKISNYMYILFQKYGRDTLLFYWNQMLPIAQQCPYAGGNAVYVMRSLVSLLNDSIEYDDKAACLQMGIYRQMRGISENNSKGGFKIIPNPANDKIEIIVSDSSNGICDIKIFDVLGKLTFFDQMKCSDKTQSVSILSLTEGTYTIKLEIENTYPKFAKLIIVR